MALRHDGTAALAIGGKFTKWMFWAVVFLTLQPLLTWFTSFGIALPLPSGGISTPWLSNIQTDIASFVTNFIVGRLVPTLAAFFVLRAILDTATGENPLTSIVAAMFLLGIETTFTLIQGYNTQTQYATADVLDSLWNHRRERLCRLLQCSHWLGRSGTLRHGNHSCGLWPSHLLSCACPEYGDSS